MSRISITVLIYHHHELLYLNYKTNITFPNHRKYTFIHLSYVRLPNSRILETFCSDYANNLADVNDFYLKARLESQQHSIKYAKTLTVAIEKSV
jgi:hypothetical protein